jgi:hypothetical protein
LPLLFIAGPAGARGRGADANDIADIVAAASPDRALVARPHQQAARAVEVEVETEFTAVEIPMDSQAPIVLSRVSDDVAVEVVLPEAASLARGDVADDGTVVYRGQRSDSQLAVQALVDGRVRIHAVLESRDAPTTYTYTLAGDVKPSLRPDGGIDLVLADETLSGSVVVGEVEAPWAVDARGSVVPTHYTVDGTTFTQHVMLTEDGA